MESKPTPKPYMNPYLAGFLLGLVLLGAFVIAGRGLGASGAIKDTMATAVVNIAPDYAAQSGFYDSYRNTTQHPMRSWLVFLAMGVIIGALVSGISSHRMELKMEKGPGISNITRAFFAVAGGLLFGLGAQFGRGCTSGAALSGMAVLSTGGILTMMTIFGVGYMVAYFFRKLWI